MLLSDSDSVLHIADFSYCASLRTISVGDKTHQLNCKTSQVLQLLINADGDIVSRDELIVKVWEDNYLVGDKGISTAIWNIRKCFKSDTASANKVSIETIPKRGYRLSFSNTFQQSFPSQISAPAPTNVFSIRGIAIIAIVAVTLSLLAHFLIPKQVNVTVLVDGDQLTKKVETTH